jgi:hypothetical protein
VKSLLSDIDLDGEGIRLLGLGSGNLVPQSAPRQHGLFDDAAGSIREETVSRLLDESHRVPGGADLKRGRLIPGAPEPEETP